MKFGIPEPEQSSWSGNKGAPMADYDISFYCEKCRQTHPLGVEIRIKNGPLVKQSVGAFLAGKPVPPEIADLIGNLHQIFLVPLT